MLGKYWLRVLIVNRLNVMAYNYGYNLVIKGLGGSLLDALELANLLIESIEDMKGVDILLLDMQGLTVIADYFLLCTSTNERQLRAIAEAVREDAKEKGDTGGAKVEGDFRSGWVLVDFGDVMVHVFSEEKRSYYNLEELWHEGKVVIRMP
ncbi:MAG: ribosome-associated protein [Cellvibrionaceae bacterium]|jgi:ribosome-associated protein